jgi:predicted acyltransferase
MSDVEDRVVSLDVLRGVAIAGMIVVDDPGTWSAVYPQLLHAQWHGWTYTDTIFPFFLFASGAAMALSFGRRRERGEGGASLLRHTALRAGILVVLGLLLNLAGFFALHAERFRVPGVLQRIGICVLAAGLVYLAGGRRAAGWSAAAILAGYWAILASGPLDAEGNLAARIDRLIFGSHTWRPGWDPEGLLSTLPAVATMLLGLVAGERLRAPGTANTKVRDLALLGAAGIAAGLLWGLVFPINKNLWTSSYAVLMSGLAALCLAAALWIVDRKGHRAWAAPFLWLGRNAIAAFTLSYLGAIALLAIRVEEPGGRSRSLWQAAYRTIFDRFADPRLGSLLFAVAYLGVWTALFGLLHRRRIFIRI